MPIICPFNTRNAVRQYVVLVQLIPLQCVALLLTEVLISLKYIGSKIKFGDRVRLRSRRSPSTSCRYRIRSLATDFDNGSTKRLKRRALEYTLGSIDPTE